MLLLVVLLSTLFLVPLSIHHAHHQLLMLWTLCNSGKNFATDFVKIISPVMFSQFLHAFQLSSTSAAIFILLSFHSSLNDKSVSNCYQFLTTRYNYLSLFNEICNLLLYLSNGLLLISGRIQKTTIPFLLILTKLIQYY